MTWKLLMYKSIVWNVHSTCAHHMRTHTYTHTYTHSVRPSDRIKLSVSKVTSDQYDRMHSDLEEIRKMGR